MTSPPRAGGSRPADRRWRIRVALPRDVTRLRWWQEQWRTRPRIALALRAALAAAVAWAIAGVLPGVAAEYPYYAPFGAVVATTFTLAGSVRESLQAVGSIVLGGLIGWLVDLLQIPFGPAAVALVVVPSVLLAGLPALGAMSGWVPTSALFTLIIGHGEAAYIGAYAGLTLLGAVIGVGVNALLPPLPLAPAQSAVGVVRGSLAHALADLADALGGEELPSLDEWQRRHQVLPRQRARMHTALAGVSEASLRNRRARRYSRSIEALEDEVRTLERLLLTVDDIADLLLGGVSSQTIDPTGPLAPELRPQICQALHTLSEALHNTAAAGVSDAFLGEDEETPTSSHDAADAVHVVRGMTDREDDELLVDSILISLRRAVDSLVRIEGEA